MAVSKKEVSDCPIDAALSVIDGRVDRAVADFLLGYGHEHLR